MLYEVITKRDQQIALGALDNIQVHIGMGAAKPRSFPEKNLVYRETALELAARAAEHAIESSGVARARIGTVLFSYNFV